MAFDAGTGLIAANEETNALVRKLGQGSDLLASLAKAVAPFALIVEKSATGSHLVGDRPAIVFVRHFATRLESHLKTHGMPLDPGTVRACIDEAMTDVLKHDLTLRLEGILQPIRPYSMSQLAFAYDLMDRECPLVFGLGPTGTGKTFLAIAAALNQLHIGNVKHVVITKPHEMIHGEQMNAAKRAETVRDEQFTVYFDILSDLIGKSTVDAMIERRQLEVTPIGLLRGRTLADSFILIDEAQNIDKHWMRLAVSRAGKNSRTIITGDPAQSTRPSGEVSGLSHLLQMIKGRDIARLHQFAPKDIVRNDTVAQLETLYAAAGETDLDLALQRD